MAGGDIGPSGYGSTSSLIAAPSSGRRTGALSVDGVEETAKAMKDWAKLSVYVVSLTSLKVATSIIQYSQRIVPFDTSALQQSAFLDSVAGADAAGYFNRATVPTSDSVEATESYVDLIPEISTSFTVPGNFGGERTYVKYSCGYTMDYAPIVHENYRGYEFRPKSKSGVPNLFGDGPKKSHFLQIAYNQHKDKFSLAMAEGIRRVNAAFAQRVGDPYKKKAPGLASGLGKPRLVKR